jgi:hypothetical protein
MTLRVEAGVTPAGFEGELLPYIRTERRCGCTETMRLSRDLDACLEQLEQHAATDAERLALYRAAMTLIVLSMGSVDDSHATLWETFHGIWKDYVTIPWETTGMLAEVFYRDLVEFTVWENYGLMAVVEHAFTEVISELRDGGFEAQENKALGLRVEFLVALSLYDRFEDAACELGARACIPIVSMAVAAMSAGKPSLALAVFAAAEQPGLQRGHLRELCAKMTGHASPQRPWLRLVR